MLVTLAGASSLRALGFAEVVSGKRASFEWLKVGGESSLAGDIYEKPLHSKMKNLMAAARGSNIELCGRQARIHRLTARPKTELSTPPKKCDFFLRSAELSVAAIRRQLGKVGKGAGCGIRCIGEAAHMDLR